MTDDTPITSPRDGYTRRTFLAGATGTVAAFALTGCASESPTVPTAPAGGLLPLASSLQDPPNIRGKLDAMTNELVQINTRLSSLQDIDADPPNIREALLDVRSAANGIVVTADDMLR